MRNDRESTWENTSERAGVDDNNIYADLEDEHQQNLGGGSDEAGDSPVIGDSRPLLVLFDCKTTGLSIYVDHITDIAAKVMNPPITLNDLRSQAL